MSVSSGTKILFETIKNGSKEDILRILQEEKKIDLHRIDKHGESVLTMPFENEKFTKKDIIDVLEYFLDRGVDPDIENEVGETALFKAAASLNKDAVDLLIKRQANVNKIYKHSNASVTHHLVQFWVWKSDHAFSTMSDAELVTMEKESASYVEWLITKGFDFERQNRFGDTALSQSLDYDLQHIALVILKHSQQTYDTNYGKNNLLHHFFNVYGFFRNRYSKIEAEKRHNYSSRYASKVVEILLGKGLSALDLNKDHVTALQLAVAREEAPLDIIDMLLDHLVWSNHHQRSDVATTVLIELFKASKWWGDESRTQYFSKVVRTLIAKGADVNAKDIKKNTALCYAFRGLNRRATDLLGENGADFGRLYDDGRNLFHELAASSQWSDKEQQEALFELLANKACCDVNARGYCARTPLHYAAQSRNLTIARKLIQHGANVNAKDSDGSTALHLAVTSLSCELVELLLTSGAEVNCKNLHGKRPFACVNRFVSRSNLLLLLKWGALVNDYHDGNSIFSSDFGRKDFEFGMEMLAYGLDINDSRICKFFESSFVDHTELLMKFSSTHWIKHEVAKLPCSDYYKKFASNYKASRQYYESCLREVAKLKSSFIDSQTSLYDYLHMDFESRVIHNNNEKMRNFVDQPDSLQQQFAQYYVLILASYRAAVRWKSLLGPAKGAWLRLTHIVLPDICVEIIFAHLRIEDLVVFIEDV